MEKDRIIIGISGKARTGKDTLAEILKSEYEKVYNLEFKTIAYADKLKQKLMEDFGLSYEQVYGDEKEIPDSRFPKSDGGFWTPREIMQFVGTECYRAIDNNYWVKALFKTIDEDKDSNYIITDCRFKSEIDPILLYGGVHIKVIREHDLLVNNKEHSSEKELEEDYKVDIKVNNSSSLMSLRKTARDIITFIDYLNK